MFKYWELAFYIKKARSIRFGLSLYRNHTYHVWSEEGKRGGRGFVWVWGWLVRFAGRSCVPESAHGFLTAPSSPVHRAFPPVSPSCLTLQSQPPVSPTALSLLSQPPLFPFSHFRCFPSRLWRTPRILSPCTSKYSCRVTLRHLDSQCLTRMSCLPRHAGCLLNWLWFRFLCVTMIFGY